MPGPKPKYLTDEEREEAHRRVNRESWRRVRGLDLTAPLRTQPMSVDEVRERRTEQMRRYRLNPERRERDRLYAREYYAKNREALLQKKAAYDETNRVKVRRYARESTRKMRAEAVAAYGGKCVICGFDNWRALQFDHVAGNGYADRHGPERLKMAPATWYRILIAQRDSGEYQLLCANDNWVKRYENNELSYARRE